MERRVDVLVPTCDRPGALAATLASLLGQTHGRVRLVVSDQGDGDSCAEPMVEAVLRVLRLRGHQVETHRHLPRRGMAEHRQFLLDRAQGERALLLDDDVLLEPDVLDRLVRHLDRERCGFVGAFVNAPSAVDSAKPIDEPPPDIALEMWDGPVRPERLVPGSDEWERRRRLHFAAYPVRVAQRLGLAGAERLYKVAWVGGCWLVDVPKLRAVGGFSFWTDLPTEHCGEDVLAQVRLQAAHGGAAMLPSGAWHQEVPTTLRHREVDAPFVLPPVSPARHGGRSVTEDRHR